MQIKNKMKLLILFFLSILLNCFALQADEFNITAKEILIDKDNEKIIGKGSVKAVDTEGKIIFADKITYIKSNEFLLAEGNVIIKDIDGNILTVDKATYDKTNEIIETFNNTELILKGGYKLITKNILYNTEKKILRSNNNSIFTDNDGNIIETSMFNYNIENNLFSAIGNIKIIDINKNKYFFKEVHIDTKKKEMVGSDVSAVLDQKNFGVSEESDPRFASNSILFTKKQSNFSKGIFTVCKERDGKCPPWSLKAKKIRHDKIKKTIYYEHATLKVYDVPIFYFPRFFHPDPSVKRQSGFLIPFFTNSTNVGTGTAIPYYWAISNDKDLTFTPKIYAKENLLFLNEYRQAFKNGLLTLDTSFTEGYKNTSINKTKGSRNHIFADLNLNFDEDDSYESNLFVNVQRTSNDTYFRVHKINTELVNSETTSLKNEIKYNFSKDNMFLNIETSAFEDLRKKGNKRYEYVLPNIMYGKTFFTEKFGTLDFQSNALYNNYDVNKHKTFFTNDVIWKPYSSISKKGFVNTFQGMLRNTNYQTKKTNEYKDDGTQNEISGVLAHKSSLPMIKDGINYANIFSPNFMLRYAPGHMIDMRDDNVALNYNNLFALNKTSEIESGLSAILGLDFTINEKVDNNQMKEKISFSLGQAFAYEKNSDLPVKSSLHQKMSDVVGEINYNFSKIGKIDYKFALDHNFNDLNYNEITTELNFGKVEFNLDYLEQQNHVGTEHYASSGISLNIDDSNKLSFSTKKNFKTESTELYDLSYQYEVDCLTAGLVYRREFYQDADVENNNTLMFSITFVPFGGAVSPAFKP
jgi:LPS-assembly protein